MLTKKSANFIDNLRLYLITSGKNEDEVKELTEELREHLIESEKRGKNMDDIIGGTPAAYMESIKAEMKTDYTGLVKNIPVYFLGVIAYFIMGPAIRGEFELNMIQVIGFPIVAAAALLIYVAFLRQAGKKQYSSKRLFLVGMIASTSVMVLFILLLLGSNLIVKSFFQASATVNWVIVGVCAFVFIAGAIWSKTWFTIWIPLLLFIPDVLFRFSNLGDETILIISGASFFLIFILLILSLLIQEKFKKKQG
ncbi:DUF1129 family protein [Bacillus sp. FSL K6-3431]|uniref:DUF1129 family protein n=1 Tax=Bacillus sp. FSL K6-3431 TaxID=2921500 RepID=UPI0030F59E04